MGFFGAIGKGLKALTPGLGGGFNPAKNLQNAGKALGGVPGMGAMGGAVGAVPGMKPVGSAFNAMTQHAGLPTPGGAPAAGGVAPAAPGGFGGLAAKAGQAAGGAVGGALGKDLGEAGLGGMAKPLPLGGAMSAMPNLAAAPDLSKELGTGDASLGGDATMAAGPGTLAGPGGAMGQDAGQFLTKTFGKQRGLKATRVLRGGRR